jgi:tRNA 2-thiouridine synthesizing protein A
VSAFGDRGMQHLVVDKRLDAGEKGCGELLILVFKAMKSMQPGEMLEVVAYSAGAPADIPAWCRLTRNPLVGVERTKPTHFFIRKGEA